MQRLQQMRMVFIVGASAILLAVATLIGLLLLSGRPDAPTPTPTGLPVVAGPSGPTQVLVDGILVTVNVDPEQQAYLQNGPIPTLAGQSVAPTLLPQVQPTPVLVVPGQEQPTPFIIPTPTFPLPTLPPPLPPTIAPALEQVIFINYVVQQGDTLYGVAAQQNSAIELMALHGIDAIDLVPGQTIRLPVANPAYCPGSRAYVVRDKDTVFRIAQQFNTTAANIRSMNPTINESYQIQVTQVICVPG
ncbi:MAG: LysM peptidoglycan-binding domain-containing protein [Chloroflexi bacterium]|nr:LysM peptidoglycan-binding domain-containing protein [Chloroflexota bacterium]MCI0644648.1 LysM peptidoglycan-binding domain-containing protein [Chloroflexota bacterium]